MKILNIEKSVLSDPDGELETLLKKGVRSEHLYHAPVIIITIKPDKWIDCFYRMFWEDNYLHVASGNRSRFDHGDSEKIHSWELFQMYMTLAEVLDFLYDATPPLYRDQLPKSTQSFDDIVELMKTFLLEESPQQVTYQSILKKITKYGVFNKPNNIDMEPMKFLRSETPTGLLCQVIYANAQISDFNDPFNDISGLYLIHANNNDDMDQFVRFMFMNQKNRIPVCEIYKDPNSGMYIMLKHVGHVFNELVKMTYKPFDVV